MKEGLNIVNNRDSYYRLIAVWVLCEAMLGGIIHGFRIPVSGLVVGSCAVTCICLIAWYVPVKGAIIKATIIVAIFKMMLSPQAPPPAYIAVFFQGLLGELLFRNRKFFRLSCMLLAVLALLESGLQRVLVLTIIYGNGLWKVINDFINGLTKQKTTTNYSLLIGGLYTLLHLFTGLIVGWWASILPKKIGQWKKDRRIKIVSTEIITTTRINAVKRRRFKKGIFIAWLLLIVLYVQSYFKIGSPLLPAHISLKILLRSLIIILAWLFIIGPLVKRLLHQWLEKRKSQSSHDIAQIVDLLPSIKSLLSECWRQSSKEKGLRRARLFTRMVLVNTLSPASTTKKRPGVFILTGPIGTGKTTSLLNWSASRTDVHGILTPVIDGKRIFMNAHTKEQFDMEAAAGEQEVLQVGRFVFSKNNFERAIQIVKAAANHPGWLVIDEVGPMELRGEGFHELLKSILRTSDGKIIIVVRAGLVKDVRQKFGIEDAVEVKGLEAVGA